MVLVPAVNQIDVCVDKYEAYLATQDPTTHADVVWPFNQVPVASNTYFARVAASVKPQGYMSGEMAGKACENSGKRLCTKQEFRAACQGPNPNQNWFPYGGTKKIKGKCNTDGINPVPKVFTGKPDPVTGYPFTGSNMNDPRLLEQDHTVTSTGAFPDCVSPHGAYDMHGNLDEWVAPVDSAHGLFAGGYFADDHLNGPGCLYLTTRHDIFWHDYSLGFRCCKNADPAS